VQALEILCLASSIKFGGRCVAGVRLDTGEWVRPVSDTPDGTLPRRQCVVDGVTVRPLDVVRVPVRGPSPRRHQPENWTIVPAAWTLVRRVPPRSAPDLLDRWSWTGRGIFGTEDDRVHMLEIGMRRRHASLTVVRVSQPIFQVAHDGGSPRVRCAFRHRGVDYDLSVTEDLERLRTLGLPATDGRHRSQRDWYLTISLTEPYDDACFKVVAGAIPRPVGGRRTDGRPPRR